jgi:hypothetical protein
LTSCATGGDLFSTFGGIPFAGDCDQLYCGRVKKIMPLLFLSHQKWKQQSKIRSVVEDFTLVGIYLYTRLLQLPENDLDFLF